MADLPLNRQPLSTLAEVIAIAGDIIREQTPLAGGGVYLSPWIDVSAYPELRLRSLSDVASAAGGVVMQWSYDGVNPIAPAAITAAALAGVLYDSGVIPRLYNFARISYGNGVGAQTTFRYALEGFPTTGGGGGGGGANVTIVAPLGIQPQAASVATNDNTANGPAEGVAPAVAVDAVVNIAATVTGQRYRVSVYGTAGVCIRVDAVDPDITDECWYDGQKFEFTATATNAAGVRAIKRTAATADGNVGVVDIV